VWEQALDLIATRQMTLEEFVARQSAWVAQIVRDYAHSKLSIQLPDVPACPVCGATTRQRNGSQGSFWSCTRYPDCMGTVAVATKSTSRPKRERTRRRSKQG